MSNRRKNRKMRMLELAAIAGVAGTVVACGSKAVDMMGSVVEDAGEAMGDAGAEWLADAGEAIADAGREMRDGSTQMAADADAQDACGTCTSSGARRTILASEDPERLLGGFLAPSGWTKSEEVLAAPAGAEPFKAWMYHAKLGEGPLLITDMLVASGAVTLYAVPTGTSCTERVEIADPFNPLRVLPPKNARTILPSSAWRLTGSRLVVRPNESLCASAGGGNTAGSGSAAADMTWAGFRPYE